MGTKIFKIDAKITQQRQRRIPLQLQEAVEVKIVKLLKEENIRRVEKIKGEVFMQPVEGEVRFTSLDAGYDVRVWADRITPGKSTAM